MAVPIPPGFDYRKEDGLDPIEFVVRDSFGLKVENWAKFRYAIHVGNESSNLNGSASSEVKDAYRELGKCHHEVISSLGYCKFAQIEMTFGNFFVLQKALKEFYFHGGAMLDILARLIYIINVSNSVTANTRKSGGGDFLRHAMDRGRLLKDHSASIPQYTPHIMSATIEEFAAVRNAIAHYWKLPIKDGQWPRDQLTARTFAWYHDESQYHGYTGWQAIPLIVQEHFEELEACQDMCFGLLLNDVTKFETNNLVTIV